MFNVQQYEKYSEKYGVKGILNCLCDKKTIVFLYDKNYYSRKIEDDWTDKKEEEMKALALENMESYLDDIIAGKVEDEKVKLYNWYVSEAEKHGVTYLRAHGNVMGHYNFWDSQFIHTSPIESIDVLEETGEVRIVTKNTRYYCPLNSRHWEDQDHFENDFPDYEKWRKKYKKKEVPPIEPGKVLLRISNYDSYYFHDLYYVIEGGNQPIKYDANPHIGTFQDSFLIMGWQSKIDLRYFPHSDNIEFYAEQTNNKPWYIENVGTKTLCARTSVGIIKLAPGERKEVKTENAEIENQLLAGGDLYPAALLDDGGE